MNKETTSVKNQIQTRENESEVDALKKRNCFQGVINRIKTGNVPKIVIIAIAVLIIIFMIVFNFSDSGNISSSKEKFDELNYANVLEQKLSAILSRVEGAGKVSVVINVESGKEMVLATKTTKTTDASGKILLEETPIVINGKTVTLKELNPKITGVLIVSEGAKSIQVMKRLQQATVSLLDININQIEILTMK